MIEKRFPFLWRLSEGRFIVKKHLMLLFVMILAFCLLAFVACDKGDNPSNPSSPSDNRVEKPIAKNNDYSNPIYPLVNGERKRTYQADPYIVRDDDGMYYMYCTQTEVYSPTIAFKRGPVWKSVDMQSWEYVSDVFANYVPDWGTSGAGVWAPTVVKVNDRWNYYYSLSVGSDTNPGIGVATSPTPYGPWTHYGKLFNSNEIGVTNSIDPHVFVDGENLYMVFGSYGGLITLIQLTSDGLALEGGLDYQKQNKVALGGYEVYDMNNYEASLIIKKDGWYYLLLSTGTCLSGNNSTYRVVCARSKDLKGPYLDSKGRNMFGPNRGDTVVAPSTSGAMGVGHCAVATDDAGEYWLLYHGYDTTNNSGYRVLYLDKLIWDDTTGMPRVENNKASNHQTRPGPYISLLEEQE